MLVTFNYSKLRGRIREIYQTESNFAKSLGISSVSLSGKLNNKVGFSSTEIMKSLKLLDIDVEEVGLYFFDTTLKKTKV